MLVKCKICKTEYNLRGAELPSSGMELKCSECGYIWVEIPDQTPNVQEFSEELSESQIVEPSTLSGNTFEGVKSDTLKGLSISDLAKQELLVQKGIDQRSLAEIKNRNPDSASSDREFEWLFHNPGEVIDNKPAKKTKSFETLTKPLDKGNDAIEHENLETPKNNPNKSSNSISGSGEEFINPKLVQRIKGVEKIQSNENDQIEELALEPTRGNKTTAVLLISSLIVLSLCMIAIFQKQIIEFFPFMEPGFSLMNEKIEKFLKYF